MEEKWEKAPVFDYEQGGDSWERQISECWKYSTKSKESIINVRYIKETKWGEMRHIIIVEVDREKVAKQGVTAIIHSEEPTYGEKVRILSKIGKWKQVALEVYPAEENLVDRANVYHLWEVESKEILPFPTQKVFESPESFNEKLKLKDCTISYAKEKGIINGKVCMYLYLKRNDGKELKWKQKQIAKNEIFMESVTAVEVICKEAIVNDYSCLICLPHDFKLGFGISQND